jgi:two-component system NtrC family sensor kinase
VEEVISLVDREATLRDIRIHRRYDEHLPVIYSDPSQLRQVFLNLINNALDAVKQGGEITLVTGRGEPKSVEVKVGDTGIGIPAESLAKIFDPFFTTKPPGKGTGLGLSICHGIIRKLGGDISVISEVGKGSTFTVHLPIEKREERPKHV